MADALKLHANAQVTRLTRVRHLEHVNENAPVVYTTVYVPHQLFPEMSQLDFTDASLYEALDARGWQWLMPLAGWKSPCPLQRLPLT